MRKNVGLPCMTTQRVSTPAPREYGSRARSISATPPPIAAELPLQTTRLPGTAGSRVARTRREHFVHRIEPELPKSDEPTHGPAAQQDQPEPTRHRERRPECQLSRRPPRVGRTSPRSLSRPRLR